MAELKRIHDQFPTIYESGRPTAVVVDMATFHTFLAAVERLEQLEDADEAWLAQVVERVRAYRRLHPADVVTYATPEAALAALDASDA